MSKDLSTESSVDQNQATINMPQKNGGAVDYHVPIIWDTHDKPYLVITGLSNDTGLCVLDNGLRSTAIAESKITRIIPSINHKDGHPSGALQYRGYNVKQLSTACTFLETSHLLIYGDLPNQEQFKTFSDDIKTHRVIDKQTDEIINTFDKQSDPMVILIAALASLASRYEGTYNMSNPDDRYQLIIRLIAKMPTVSAHIYKHIIGQRPVESDENLGHTANFLHMLHTTQAKQTTPEQNHIKILDMILTLHADHQMAVSTFVTRATSSAGTPSISSICAAIAALSGPLHGGANIKVIEMLEAIPADEITSIIEKASDPKDPFKLYGFGHRVYQGMDPRASVLRELTLKVIKDQQKSDDPDPIYETALKLEEAALNNPYFKERNLYPNVDFYSGLALRALGIPKELFTVIFAMSRTSGWLAHIEESWLNNEPLLRPKQYFTGLKERPLDWP